MQNNFYSPNYGNGYVAAPPTSATPPSTTTSSVVPPPTIPNYGFTAPVPSVNPSSNMLPPPPLSSSSPTTSSISNQSPQQISTMSPQMGTNTFQQSVPFYNPTIPSTTTPTSPNQPPMPSSFMQTNLPAPTNFNPSPLYGISTVSPQQSFVPQQSLQQPMQQQPLVSPQQQPFVPPQAKPQVLQQQQPMAQQKGIDPNQIPSPARYKYPQYYYKNCYKTITNSDVGAPSSNGSFYVEDEGSCNPRFMRPTLYKLPQTEDMLKSSGLPMGVLINPLAELDVEDKPQPIPMINLKDLLLNNPLYHPHYSPQQQQQQQQQSMDEQQPIRCSRCRAYINPFVRFIQAGNNFVCNFCGVTNDVPKWYVANLDGYGNRRDASSRPELKYGSVEYDVSDSKLFKSRPNVPLHFVIAIDVSSNAQSQGVTTTVIRSLKSVVKQLVSMNDNCKLCVLTFAKSIQFYQPNTSPQMLVTSGASLDELFTPLHSDRLLLPVKDWTEEFVDKLVYWIGGNTIKENENCLGSVIEVASQLLSQTGGKLLCFSSLYPSVGVAHYRPRQDFKLYGSDKERVLFQSQINTWKEVNGVEKYAKQQLSVDLFLFPNTFLDSATLASITSITNGHLYVYTGFHQWRDGERVYQDLEKSLCVRQSGVDAILKIRTSNNLSVKKFYGNFFSQSGNDMDLAAVDGDTCFCVELKHDQKLEDNMEHFVQSALLYTNRQGKRMIRVHTLKLGTCNTVSNVFKHADLDSTLNMYCKLFTNQALKSNDTMAFLREQVFQQIINVLFQYRKHCSPGSNPGQLVLPESLKLLPVYLLGFVKSPAFRPGTDVNIDDRVVTLNNLMNMTNAQIMQYCYPKLFNLSDLLQQLQSSDVMTLVDPHTQNEIMYPCAPVPLTSAKIDNHGMYLLDDGINTYFWIGRNCSAELLEMVFGVNSLDQISLESVPKPNRNTSVGNKIYLLLQQELRKNRTRNGSLRIFREKDASEVQFFGRLIEDRTNSVYSYTEFLVYLHKEISQRS